MGVNLKCASCHDSFINDWQLSDAYGLANVFSDQPLEIYRCDLPTGTKGRDKIPLSATGRHAGHDQQAGAAARAGGGDHQPQGRSSFAHHGQPALGQIFGRGLVEPVDDMQQTAWDPDVLDWLAEDLVAHHYDVKHTMERIMTSRAYQMPAVDMGERQQTNFVFTGPEVRRMTAEAISRCAGHVDGCRLCGAGGSGGDERIRKNGIRRQAEGGMDLGPDECGP